MMRNRNGIVSVWVLVLVLLAWGSSVWSAPRNAIIMIGDGMGFEQVEAAGHYANGEAGKFGFEEFYKGELHTYSSNSYLGGSRSTDSAASATAMATGSKTDNGVVSQSPNGQVYGTLLERFKAQGRAVGLVTTVPMTHATPAAFGSHEGRRGHYDAIARDYFEGTRPNILFGAYKGDGTGITQTKAQDAGYLVVKNRAELSRLVSEVSTSEIDSEFFASGQFVADQLPYEYDCVNELLVGGLAVTYESCPHLSEMTAAALDVLDRDADGFFLMVEGGAIDWAGHGNSIERLVYETIEFSRAFDVVREFADGRDDTLVIVTADHETGDLTVIKGRGKGFFPQVFWGSGGHTGVNVPVYAFGPNADLFTGVHDNTFIFEVSTK